MLLCAASPLNQYSQELSSWQAIFHLQQNASNAFYAINFIMVYAHLQPMSQNKNNAVRLNSTAENEYLMDRKKQQCFETEQGMQTLGNIFQQFCQCSSVLTGNNSAILHYQDLFFVNSLKCFVLFFAMACTNGEEGQCTKIKSRYQTFNSLSSLASCT